MWEVQNIMWRETSWFMQRTHIVRVVKLRRLQETEQDNWMNEKNGRIC